MNDKELKQLFQKVRQVDALEQPNFEALLEHRPAKRVQLYPYGKWAAAAASILLCIGMGYGILQQQSNGNEEIKIVASNEQNEEMMLPSDALLEGTASNISNWQAPSEFINPNDNSLLTNWESPTDFLLTLD